MRHTPAMWYAGFDYVRLTMPTGGDDEGAKSVYGKAARACVASADGEIPTFKPWAAMGYYGETCGAASYGIGRQGAILQVSGGSADNLSGMGVPFAGAPRVDVQVTVWLHDDTPGYAAGFGLASLDARERAHGSKWRVRLIEGFGDGDTLYLGSRESDCFVRIYDKWRESGCKDVWRHAWRFEVELKNERAKEVWSGACSARQSPETAAGWLRWYLGRWGVRLPETVRSVLAAQPEAPNRQTDNERRLAWLHNQVRPSLERMLASGVSLERALSALGLDATKPGVLE